MEKILWLICAAIVILALVCIWFLIRSGYVKEVKSVLLYFVTQAEQFFGGKTGKLKKAAVISWVYEKLPNIIRFFISSEEMSYLIENAVEDMKKYLAENTAAAALVTKEAPKNDS